MDQDLRAFRELVLWIYDKHHRAYESRNHTAQRIYSRLKSERFSHRLDLERNLPSEDEVSKGFPRRKYLYLEPVLKGRVMAPLLRMSCDFGRNPPEVRLRLELFLLQGEEIKAFGVRFESPEGPGMHNYYHAQLIADIPAEGATIDWLPDGQPALPIDAYDPIGLLVSILVSLYGVQYLNQIKSGVQSKVVDSRIEGMLCHSDPPSEHFWAVQMKDPAKPETAYRTSDTEDRFKVYIHGTYTGCHHRGITKAAYEAFPVAQRRRFPE